MTYSTHHPTPPLFRRPKFQQESWTYNYREDRTSVTNPSNVIEAAQKPATPHINDTNWGYWVPIHKSSQDTPGPVRNLRIEGGWEIIPSSSEAIRALVSQCFIRSWHPLIQNNWFASSGSGRWIISGSSDAFHNSAKSILVWNEKSTSTTFLTEAQLQLIEGRYFFRNDAEVKHFLREDPFLVQLLIDTFSKIEAHFPDSQVFLEVATDYEAFDYYSNIIGGDRELVASIATHVSPKEAMKSLNEFYDDWWLKALEDAKGKFSFSLEFL